MSEIAVISFTGNDHDIQFHTRHDPNSSIVMCFSQNKYVRCQVALTCFLHPKWNKLKCNLRQNDCSKYWFCT